MTTAAAVAIYPIPPAPMPEAGSHQGSGVGSAGVSSWALLLWGGLPPNDEMKRPPKSGLRLHPSLDPNPLIGVPPIHGEIRKGNLASS